MAQQSSVTVKQFPQGWDTATCRSFLNELQILLANTYQPEIVFDLSGVRQVDAAAIDLLLKCVIEIAEADGMIKLAAPSPEVALVLELTQMDGVLQAYDSVEEAMASFGVYLPPPVSVPESLPQAA